LTGLHGVRVVLRVDASAFTNALREAKGHIREFGLGPFRTAARITACLIQGFGEKEAATIIRNLFLDVTDRGQLSYWQASALEAFRTAWGE
jgi:hypothetical protein